MPLKKLMKGVPPDPLPADGLWSLDSDAVTPCQIECVNRLGKTIQIEQENYLLRHPEVKVMVELLVSKMIQKNKRKDVLKDVAEHFTRPMEDIEREVNDRLTQLGSNKQGLFQNMPPLYEDADLKDDIRDLITTHYKTEPPKYPSKSASTLNTQSSSFISIKTSDTTLPTPEPIPTPELTLSETLFMMVSNTVDKAIFLRVDDTDLNYDTAYMELVKAVEKSMDIPVIEIRKDIADLFSNAYEMFEFKIKEKERILAEIAWEKRMRKKLKKSLRRLYNFKGHETPSTPRSEISSHESYKIPPPRPCICHPQFNFNRYPKDRFGIYLPSENIFSTGNITVTPAVSTSSEDGSTDKAYDGSTDKA